MSTPDLDDVTYKCCWHCGVNYPTKVHSYCERNPHSHKVPCNESGECEGKEVYLGEETVSPEAEA